MATGITAASCGNRTGIATRYTQHWEEGPFGYAPTHQTSRKHKSYANDQSPNYEQSKPAGARIFRQFAEIGCNHQDGQQ
jgi:hypothetical protein